MVNVDFWGGNSKTGQGQAGMLLIIEVQNSILIVIRYEYFVILYIYIYIQYMLYIIYTLTGNFP